MIGRKLAHFRVVDALGRGGMGEVYRAEDTKLGREVALKILPSQFADDAERMARFSREAKMLASLNHPNIAGIYQIEQADDLQFLVMELIEGETLAELLQRGPISLDESLEISRQVVAGLEEAHDRGIVHRDLKPANIKITPKGKVKVLDFGLAKAKTDLPVSPDSVFEHSQSPTLTAPMTGTGVLMGTAAYMSPEQARGEEADRRADIWAFGVVLMEMLTGSKVFAAKTVSDTLAGVLAREPEWGKLPSDTPTAIRRLLQRCLDKNHHTRLQAIGEARIAIDSYLEDPTAAKMDATGSAPIETPVWKRLGPWALATILAVALGAALIADFGTQTLGTDSATHSSVLLPEGKKLIRGYGAPAILSPSGDRIVQTFEDGLSLELYLRSINQWEGSTLIKGVDIDRPYHPFFSPDGQWIGFATPNSLRKIPITGGRSIKLCDANLSRGASWGPDGKIVVARNNFGVLWLVPEAGGEPEALTELDAGAKELTHRWPQFLPGGKQVLFTAHMSADDFDNASIWIIDVDTRQRTLILQGGTFARYVASGHIVFYVRETLFAVPFDLDGLEVTGSPAPAMEGVAGSSRGGAYYDVSSNGTLIFFTGKSDNSAKLEAVWVDRQGAMESLWDGDRDFRNPSLSPDGRRLAVEIAEGVNTDIWVYDLEREVPSRLTFGEGRDGFPIWSPDGRWIVFSSNHEADEKVGSDGVSNLYRIAADGSGAIEKLTENDQDLFPTSWSPDGKTIALVVNSPGGSTDIVLLDVDSGSLEPFVATDFQEYGGVFSPDGRYLAYGSNASGSWQVYVRPSDGSRGEWRVSGEPAGFPQWSRDGSELFFGADEESGRVLSATVRAEGNQLLVGNPREVVSGEFAALGMDLNMYAVAPDGQRFVVFRGEAASASVERQHLNLVTNWFVELEEIFSNQSTG